MLVNVRSRRYKLILAKNVYGEVYAYDVVC